MTYEEAVAYVKKWGIGYAPACDCTVCAPIKAGGGMPEDKPVASAPAGIDATLQDRGKTYGVFADQAIIDTELKAAMHRGKRYGDLAPDQRLALDMIANKISRILNGDPNFHDSWHDISGYAKLVADRLTT